MHCSSQRKRGLFRKQLLLHPLCLPFQISLKYDLYSNTSDTFTRILSDRHFQTTPVSALRTLQTSGSHLLRRALQTSGTYLLRQRSRVWDRSQRRAPREGEVAAVIPAGVGLTKGRRKGGKAQRLGEVVGQDRTIGVASAAQVRSADECTKTCAAYVTTANWL
jgi:hypothetical protein